MAIGKLHALMFRDLAPHFDQVNVVYVPGNHGRRSKKKNYHGAQDNWDFLIAELARLYCADIDNVEFVIPDAFSVNLDIGGVGFNISHGDDVRGSLGIPYYGLQRRQRSLTALAHTQDGPRNALYGVKLGSAFDGSEVKLIPLVGPVAWTIVRVEPDTYSLTESTILLLNDFAATPPEDRHEDLEACIYEGADYAAGALLRMLERRQQERCEALVRELERIQRDATAHFNGNPSADGSGSDDTKLTANAAADNNPIPVLLVNLSNFDMALAWLV